MYETQNVLESKLSLNTFFNQSYCTFIDSLIDFMKILFIWNKDLFVNHFDLRTF